MCGCQVPGTAARQHEVGCPFHENPPGNSTACSLNTVLSAGSLRQAKKTGFHVLFHLTSTYTHIYVYTHISIAENQKSWACNGLGRPFRDIGLSTRFFCEAYLCQEGMS